MIYCAAAIIFVAIFSGVACDCSGDSTSLHCTDSFLGKPVTLDVDLEACRDPVKLKVRIEIVGIEYEKEFEGSVDIPIPGAEIEGLGGIFLNVDPKTLDNGDLRLKIGIKVGLFGIKTKSLTMVSKTIPNSDCNVFLKWWNSLDDAPKYGGCAAVALVAIFLLTCCCCCCCCRCCRSRREGVVQQVHLPNAIIPNRMNPAGNQFQYQKQIDEVQLTKVV